MADNNEGIMESAASWFGDSDINEASFALPRKMTNADFEIESPVVSKVTSDKFSGYKVIYTGTMPSDASDIITPASKDGWMAISMEQMNKKRFFVIFDKK